MPAVTDEPNPARSRWWLGALAGGALVAGLAAHNTREVVRVRDRARALNGPRDHNGTIGYGIGDPVRLVVIGDSSADGFGLPDASVALPRQIATRLAKVAGRPVHLTSLAKDGAHTRDVTTRQVPFLRRLDADVVVVVAGVNDAVGGARPRRVAHDTATLVDRLLEIAPDAAITYVGCPNLRFAPGLPKPLHLVVGLACRQIARAQRGVLASRPVSYVDLFRPLEAEDFGPDGFHPGAQGSARIAALVVDALTTVTKESPWTST